MTNQTPSNEIDRRLEVLETGIAEVRTRQEANTTSTLTLQTEMRVMQNEIQQIWQYLVGQQGNGHRGGE